MKALILNNRVVDTAETAFEVAEPLFWMDCTDECKAGEWEVVDGTLQAIPEPEDTRTYVDFRRAAYPSLTDQADMAYWDRQNNTTTLDDAISAVKIQFPKP
jgi:hypothetical protein